VANKYLLEAGTDGYLLEDGSGVLLLEDEGVDVIPAEIEVEGATVGLTPLTFIDVVPGEIEFESATVELFSPDFIRVEPGEIEAEGATVSLVPRQIVNIEPGVIQLRGADVYSELNEQEPVECIFIIDLLPPALTGQVQIQLGRLTVDDVVIPIREWEYVEQKDRTDSQVNVTLADVADRTAITQNASIKFEIGTLLVGVRLEDLVNGPLWIHRTGSIGAEGGKSFNMYVPAV
jgi:hypothetical protein